MLHFLHFLNLLMLYSSMHSSNAQGDQASMEALLNKQLGGFPRASMDMQLSAVYTLDEKGRLIPVGPGQNSGHSVDNPSHSKPMLSPIHTQGG